MIWVMGSGTQAESNRLWAVMAIAAIVVIGLFVFDPFGGQEASNDGLFVDDDGAPFIAVIQHDRAPSRNVDEPEEVLDVVVEAEPMTKPATDGDANVDANAEVDSRGQRTTADG